MRTSTDICVIGAGPAGSVLAARLAQLGHKVCLVERSAFPRRHLGESLSPGVLPLLATVGLPNAAASVRFTPVHSVKVNWDQGPQERQDPAGQGRLVDRGQFDQMLLDHARSAGVRVFQPAIIDTKVLREDGWVLRIKAKDGPLELRAGFLADATGRAALLRSRRRRTGARTVALYAYWQGRNLPKQPRIKAGAAEWYWGVPLPDGIYNTLIFMEPARFRAIRAGGLAVGFRALIEAAGLLTGCRDARLLGAVSAADATPYLEEESVTGRSIKVGDAALALDPLSSSGVQKSIQTALAGAIVTNTLLRKPTWSEAAFRFYRDSLRAASERHSQWAAGHYGAVAAKRPGRFWQDRAAGLANAAGALATRAASGPWPPKEAPLVLSPQVTFVDLPCLAGSFVQVKAAVQHPALEEPVAYLGDWELVPLLHRLRAGLTERQVAMAWAPTVPLDAGGALARWLVGHGILVPHRVAEFGGPAMGRARA